MSEHHYHHAAVLAAVKTDILTDSHLNICFHPVVVHKYKAPFGSIVIRGPNC